MLLFLRKHFHKGFTQGLVLVTALSLIGIGSLSQIVTMFFSDSRVVFSVNGLGVTKQQFGLRAATEKNILDYYKNQLGEMAPRFLAQAGISMSPEKNAYNKMVQELALVSAVKRSGLGVSVKAVAQKAQDPMALMNIFGQTLPRALYDRNGKIQQELLARVLSNVGLTLEDFELLLEQSVEQELAYDLLRLSIPVTEKELVVQAIKTLGTRHFTIQFYSTAEYLKKAEAKPVDAETLKAFFEKHNNQSHRYWSPESKKGTEMIPAALRPYEAVQKEVKRDYYLEEAQKLASEDINGTGIETLPKTHTQKIVIKPGTQSKEELKKLSKEGLATDKIDNMFIEGSEMRGLLENRAYKVTLGEVEMPQKLSDEQRLTIRNAVLKENERLVTATSVDSLVKNAKIRSNNLLESSQADLN